MLAMDLNVSKLGVTAIAVGLLAIAGCTSQQTPPAPKNIQLQQKWQLQPGDTIADYPVIGGLGDIAIALRGEAIYAPIDGLLQPYKPNCVIFSSAEVPIYSLRLCGLKNPKFGQRRVGEAIATADVASFAVLHRRSDNKWAFVEPSKQILELMLQPSLTPTVLQQKK